MGLHCYEVKKWLAQGTIFKKHITMKYSFLFKEIPDVTIDSIYFVILNPR